MMKTISRLLSGLLLATFFLAACGGGGGSSSPPPAVASNVMSVVVDRGPTASGNVNQPFVSITICAPGSTTSCQTIDHVLVDTGSTGLRLVAEAMDGTMLAALPSKKNGSGDDLLECQAFVSGYMWGAIRLADVNLGGLTAGSVAIQLVGDPAAPAVPGDCSSRGGGVPMNTIEDLGAKGVLGIDGFVSDCPACAQAATYPVYYTCPDGTCASVQLAEAEQVRNPVAVLPSDNNGFLLDMPAVGATGATNVTGSLILGIGTRSNNALGTAKVFDLDAYGLMATWYNGQGYWSFVDSGSNGLFFPDTAIPACTRIAGFYCPAPSPLALSAEVAGANTNNWTVIEFSVADADSLLATFPNTSYSNLAGDWPGAYAYFDWGMPFFYGRRIFFAIEDRSTPGGTGPYVAF